MSLNTISCFTNLVVIEHLFCINRSYLINCPRKKLISNLIFSVTFTLLITFVIINILSSSNGDSGRLVFKGVMAFEFLVLAVSARVRRNSFDALKRLDEKCGVEIDYIEKLVSVSSKYTFFVLTCAVIDVVGLLYLRLSVGEIVFAFILYSAQDTELIFFSMIVEAINLRLEKLKDASFVYGSKVYRHVLVTIALMNEEVSPLILMVLATVLGTTVTYFCVIMLSLADQGPELIVYLLWREVKVFFCVWRVCHAASSSDAICQRLALQLASRLALDLHTGKAKSTESRAGARWWWCSLRAQPRFVHGPVLDLGLAVPMNLLDLSVNYVLIIVQIYVAYN